MYLIINNHSKNIPFIESFLKKSKRKYKVLDRSSSFKEFANKSLKGIILSGGKTLSEKVLFKDVRADIYALINSKVPVLGICAGHQVMAMAFGSSVVRLKVPSIKNDQLVKLDTSCKLFKGLPNKIRIYEHHFRYVKNLNPLFKIVASSSKNKVEAIAHKKLPFFGVQFHPEKNEEFGTKILENFLILCE